MTKLLTNECLESYLDTKESIKSPAKRFDIDRSERFENILDNKESSPHIKCPHCEEFNSKSLFGKYFPGHLVCPKCKNAFKN